MKELETKPEVIDKEEYAKGRRACKAGKNADANPHKGGLEDSTSNQRLSWGSGYYDQYYGEKWEPKDQEIEERIWPVHL